MADLSYVVDIFPLLLMTLRAFSVVVSIIDLLFDYSLISS